MTGDQNAPEALSITHGNPSAEEVAALTIGKHFQAKSKQLVVPEENRLSLGLDRLHHSLCQSSHAVPICPWLLACNDIADHRF